jgi:hypothetical protein
MRSVPRWNGSTSVQTSSGASRSPADFEVTQLLSYFMKKEPEPALFGHSVTVSHRTLDEAIAQHIRKTYSLLIGERTAAAIRMELGIDRFDESCHLPSEWPHKGSFSSLRHLDGKVRPRPNEQLIMSAPFRPPRETRHRAPRRSCVANPGRRCAALRASREADAIERARKFAREFDAELVVVGR